MKISKEQINLQGEDVWRLEFDKIIDTSSVRLKLNMSSLLIIVPIFAITFIYFIFWFFPKLRYVRDVGSSKVWFAFHPDDSNRSLHLKEIVRTFSPQSLNIVIVGRFNKRSLLSCQKKFDRFKIIVPFDLKSFIFALADILILYKKGIVQCSTMFNNCSTREIFAVTFRVTLGAVSSRWWLKTKIDSRNKVIFAITGTADTSLQESSIQSLGAKTIHAVHGQAVGSNFLAYSDLAIFRSKYDMNYYKELNCYKAVTYIKKNTPPVVRGESGIIIFSNFAHPVNAAYKENGLTAEINFIRSILRLKSELRFLSGPVVWKPHPTFVYLCPNDQAKMQELADENSIQLLINCGDISEYASKFKWVFSTPSTIVIDLLLSGVLSFVLDPLHTAAKTSISPFVVGDKSDKDLSYLLLSLLDRESYIVRFNEMWNLVGPGASLGYFKKNSDLIDFIDSSFESQVNESY